MTWELLVCVRFSATRFVALLQLSGMRASPFDFPFDPAQGFVVRPQAKTWQALHPSRRKSGAVRGPGCGIEEETFIFRTAVG
jgi:hypothetical protein